MAKHQFSPSERYAVFTVHGEICYLCRNPIDMATFQVDHIIPESLEDHPEFLAEVLQSYGLTDNFDLNSFENWMPACDQCNNRKRASVFEALPINAVEVQRAAYKADRTRQLETDVISKQQIGRALTIIEAAQEEGSLEKVHFDRLKPLIEYHEANRETERANTPWLIGPGLEILRKEGDLLTVRGPYGIGVGRENAPHMEGSVVVFADIRRGTEHKMRSLRSEGLLAAEFRITRP